MNKFRAPGCMIVYFNLGTQVCLIIMVAQKGETWDFIWVFFKFFNFFCLQSPHCAASPTRTLRWPGRNRVQITCTTSGAYHVQHAVCRDGTAYKLLRYERTAQPSSLQSWNRIYISLTFIGWNHWTTEDGRKPESPGKNPDNELQKMPHTKSRKIKPQTRLKPALWRW